MRVFFSLKVPPPPGPPCVGPGTSSKKQKLVLLATPTILLAFALPLSTVAESHGSPKDFCATIRPLKNFGNHKITVNNTKSLLIWGVI